MPQTLRRVWSCTFALACFLSLKGYSQTRPSSTISQRTGGICVGCQISDPDSAWDNDPVSYASLEVNLADVGGYGEVVYEFTDPMPVHSTLKLQMQFSGTGFLSGLATKSIFDRLNIQLLDAAGAVLATYNDTQTLQVDILSEAENTFEVRIINPDAATQRLKIRSGNLASIGLVNRDLLIHDILYATNDILPVTTVEEDGVETGLIPCIGCGIQDETHATASFDLNSDYTTFYVPLSVNLNTGYVYTRYSWGSTGYDGSAYDIYLTLQDAELLALGTELLFLENSNLSVEVTYDDATKETFEYGNSALTADVLGAGSGRFFLKLDANDSKNIEQVEVRFGGNLANVLNGLRLYSVFLSPTTHDPFMYDKTEATATVASALRVDEYANGQTLLSVNDTDGLLVFATLSAGDLPPGTQLNTSTGEVTVSNKNDLKAGEYTLTLGTTDPLGGTSAIEATINILAADQEATYTVLPPKPVNDLAKDDVLATVLDADGTITAASVTSGSLPSGVTLANDGAIKVADESELVAGTYSVEVTTTDEEGGTTNSTIELIILPADQEAVYTVNSPKPVNDYADNDVLATASDPNGAITEATVISGNLPAGASLQTNGSIQVADAMLLVAGTYTSAITTTDVSGGTTDHTVTIVIYGADIEAQYTVEAFRPVSDYENNDVLASATDANGTVVSAVVSTGSLPTGVQLDNDGTLIVANAEQLVADTYSFTIATIDSQGGATDSEVVLTFLPDDQEAIYDVAASKPSDQYVDGEVLATVTDADGAITVAVITSGSLPDGTVLSADGTISVSQTSQLTAGSSILSIRTTDEAGGSSDHTIALVIKSIGNTDTEAMYTIKPPKPVNDYTPGEAIATVSDADGAITTATVEAGTLPPGLQLETSGSIAVDEANLLAEGRYSLVLTTTDVVGGTTTHSISLQLYSVDSEAVYSTTKPLPVNDYTTEDILATVSDANGHIITAIVRSGSLPLGVVLANDGTLKVADESELVAGTYTSEVTTTDEYAGTTDHTIEITLLPEDQEAVYTVHPAKSVSDYTDGEAVATATDANGDISSALLSEGNLPAGIVLEDNGTLTVADATQLEAGTYSVSVTTTDVAGGTTESTVELRFESSDQEAVYMIHPAKRQSEYQPGDSLATVTDADGMIVSATVSQGSLPDGVAMQSDGTVQVSNAAALVPGSYELIVTTQDAIGGTSESALTLTISPDDHEAVYTLHPSKPVSQYQPGDTIARVSDQDGSIVLAGVTQGTLPTGMILQTDGTIVIEDPTELAPGETMLTITTTDAGGGTTASSIQIVVSPDDDTEAQYTVLNPQEVNAYEPGDTLATASDADGEIKKAVVANGAPPAGTILQDDGTILVKEAERLEAGSYTITVTTTDARGGTTQQEVVLVLLPASEEDVATDINVLPAKPVDQYQPNDTLVRATDEDGAIVKVVIEEGVLPEGTQLGQDGNVTVTDPQQLMADTYPITLTFTDERGGETTQAIEIVLGERSHLVTPWPGFSPDGDGANDAWRIDDIEEYSDNVVKIFNRWGEVVFVQEGYNNEGQAWTGRANNGLRLGSGNLPNGTYFYLIDLGDGTPPLTGYIVLKY